jgi:hypothetical protein
MTFYRIDGEEQKFRSLRNAKHHIWIAYNQNERLLLHGSNILKFKNDKIETMTPIYVTEDGYSFGKTIKI